jgi:hypothetical protein
MLSINPKMLPRLDDLEADLISRRERAIAQDWRGEIEGIELTLTFLRAKRNQGQRALTTTAAVSVNLGMPATKP